MYVSVEIYIPDDEIQTFVDDTMNWAEIESAEAIEGYLDDLYGLSASLINIL